ncbi:hypothetical protein VTO42DRAFT_7971 [Malbranchea cinnamomea]
MYHLLLQTGKCPTHPRIVLLLRSSPSLPDWLCSSCLADPSVVSRRDYLYPGLLGFPSAVARALISFSSPASSHRKRTMYVLSLQ